MNREKKEKNLRVISFIGEKIHQLIPEIAALRMEIFHEYPYLYVGDEEYEKKYLSKFAMAKDAIIVVAYDGSKIVGVSTGLPIIYDLEEVKKPFIEAGYPLEEVYYFGASVLKKEYRERGIGHQFFDHREKHVLRFGRYRWICFCAVKRDPQDPRRPKNYRELNSFWESRGYQIHPELSCYIPWQEIGEEGESPKELVFWVKKL